MCVRLRVQIFPMWTWQEDRVRFGFFLQMCAITSSLFLIGRLGIAYKSNYICEWLSEGLDWIGGSWILGDHVFPRHWDDEKKVKQSMVLVARGMFLFVWSVFWCDYDKIQRSWLKEDVLSCLVRFVLLWLSRGKISCITRVWWAYLFFGLRKDC